MLPSTDMMILDGAAEGDEGVDLKGWRAGHTPTTELIFIIRHVVQRSLSSIVKDCLLYERGTSDESQSRGRAFVVTSLPATR